MERFRIMRAVACIIPILLLAGMFPVPGHAQTPAAKFKVAKQSPITRSNKFTLGDFKDPATGSPLQSTAKVTLRTSRGLKTGHVSKNARPGKIAPVAPEVTGDVLVKTVNKVEGRLNPLGYTLRNKQTKIHIPTLLNTSALQAQRQKVQSSHHALVAAAPFKSYDKDAMATRAADRKKLRTGAPGSSSSQKIGPGVLPKLSSATPGTAAGKLTVADAMNSGWAYLAAHPVNYTGSLGTGMLGDVGVIWTEVKATVSAAANGSALSTGTHSETSASLMGKGSITLLSVDGLAEIKNVRPGEPALHGSLRVNCAGIDKSLFDETRFLEGPHFATFSQPVDFSVPVPGVDMGICDINAVVGLEGQAGVDFCIYCEPSYVQAFAKPHVSANAYIQADLTAEFLGLGFGVSADCDLTILDDNMDLGGSTGLGMDKPDPYIYTEYYGDNTLHALAGSMSVTAEFDYLIGSAESTWDICSWDGISLSGYFIQPTHVEHSFTGATSTSSNLIHEVKNYSFTINQPPVNVSSVTFDGREGRAMYLFQPGDIVTLKAGGCVQTGGKGKTWKRYVNPSGDNSDRLYFGLVNIPGVTGGLKPIRSTGGTFDGAHPDEYTVTFSKPVPEGLPEQQRYLVLGYTDDAYQDNGYYAHDDGNGDQCRSCRLQNAWVTITITRAVP